MNDDNGQPFRETITYFPKPARKEANAVELVRLVAEYLREHPIRHVVIASSWGRSAVKLVAALEDRLGELNVVVVKLSAGCEKVLSIEFDPANRQFLEARGVPILTSTHSLTCAVDYALAKRGKGASNTELIAEVLRLFCPGMNTCVEISLMTADAALVPAGVEALVIGGTNGWADTAVILRTATTPHFFDLRIRKVLAKPTP